MEFDDFEDFLRRICGDEFVRFAASRVDAEVGGIQALVETYANEARFGREMLGDRVTPDIAVLDVGAGIGVLSAWLHLQGARVTAIEPNGTEFVLNHRVGQAIKAWLDIDAYHYEDRGVEDLAPGTDGPFDLIYSVNVIEHLPDTETAMAKMASVLSTSGSMLHTCPNYAVPYEPHFAVPLLPFVPRASRWLLPDRVTQTALWESLNFVTVGRIRRAAANAGLAVIFERETMYRSFARLDGDPLFAERQSGLVRSLYRFLRATGVMHLVRHWPPTLATPMAFECRHRARAG